MELVPDVCLWETCKELVLYNSTASRYCSGPTADLSCWREQEIDLKKKKEKWGGGATEILTLLPWQSLAYSDWHTVGTAFTLDRKCRSQLRQVKNSKITESDEKPGYGPLQTLGFQPYYPLWPGCKPTPLGTLKYSLLWRWLSVGRTCPFPCMSKFRLPFYGQRSIALGLGTQ